MNTISRVIIAYGQKQFSISIRSILATFNNIEIIAEACNADELILHIQELNPSIILVDLQMQGMDGLKVLNIIKQKYNNIQIILLTFIHSEHFLTFASEQGVSGCINKNSAAEEIETAIKTLIPYSIYGDSKTNSANFNNPIKGKKNKALSFNQIFLNDNELGVLRYLCSELTSAQISNKMYLSQRTIEGIRQDLMRKTNSKNVVGLIVFAIKNGLIDICSVEAAQID